MYIFKLFLTHQDTPNMCMIDESRCHDTFKIEKVYTKIYTENQPLLELAILI